MAYRCTTAQSKPRFGQLFDFMTCSEFPEESAPQFDELRTRLPVTEEYRYASGKLRRASLRQRHVNWETP
jgi:hypothetical protein